MAGFKDIEPYHLERGQFELFTAAFAHVRVAQPAPTLTLTPELAPGHWPLAPAPQFYVIHGDAPLPLGSRDKIETIIGMAGDRGM